MAELLQILFIGTGVYPIGYPYLKNLSVSALKDKVQLLKKIECATQDVRLYQAKKALHKNDWLAFCDPDVKQFIRLGYFKELAAKYTKPELEMQEGRFANNYFNKRTLRPSGLDQMHVTVVFPSEFFRVWCRETYSYEKPEIVLKLFLAAERRRAEEWQAVHAQRSDSVEGLSASDEVEEQDAESNDRDEGEACTHYVSSVEALVRKKNMRTKRIGASSFRKSVRDNYFTVRTRSGPQINQVDRERSKPLLHSCHSTSRSLKLKSLARDTHFSTRPSICSSMVRGGDYYAAAKGHEVGTGDDEEVQIKDHAGASAQHNKFSTEADALVNLLEDGVSATSRAVATSDSNVGAESARSHLMAHPRSLHDDRDDVARASANEIVDSLSELSISEQAHVKSEAMEKTSLAQEEKPKGATTFVNELWYYERTLSSAAQAPPDPRHKDTLVAFCAGRAPGNGQPDCQAGYACLFPHCEGWDVALRVRDDDRATNVRADYSSALEAMKCVNKHVSAKDQVLFIFTSNLNLIRSMTEWIDKWRANNWRKPSGSSVENRDLLEQLLAAQGKRRILWRHVKAHTSSPDWKSKWLEKASRAASSVARDNAGRF